jgi:N-hydroxyarylamine O-acetyltransferase
MFDFDAYLRRIGLDPADEPDWQAVHRAHATTIPFENLDSHRGIPVSLEQADLERKLVAGQRAGTASSTTCCWRRRWSTWA